MIESWESKSSDSEEYLKTLINEENNVPTPIELDVQPYLRKLRVVGLLIVYNYAVFGPVTTYYSYSEGSELAKKYAFNPASLAELSLVAKHTKTLEGIADTRALLDTFELIDEFNRSTQGYILIEFKRKAPITKIRDVVDEIKKLLSVSKDLEETKKILEDKLKTMINNLSK